MVCAFCSEHIDTEKEAISLGWIFSFWANDTEYEGPVCGGCCEGHLIGPNDDGEAYIKDDEKLPMLAIPLLRRPTNCNKRKSDLG